MEILKPQDYRVGDHVLFDGSGPAFFLLSNALTFFDPEWKALKRKPWHVAVIVKVENGKVWIVEGWCPKSRIRELTPKDTVRVFRWFKKPLNYTKVINWCNKMVGKPYNIFIYLYTAMVILIHYKTGFRLPAMNFDLYDCWELLVDFDDDMGKEICEDWETALITTICKNLGLTK